MEVRGNRADVPQTAWTGLLPTLRHRRVRVILLEDTNGKARGVTGYQYCLGLQPQATLTLQVFSREAWSAALPVQQWR